MGSELTLRIVLEKPPAGVDFGLQKGRGSAYETIQTQRSTAKDLYFEFTVALKARNAVPDFSGSFVQGTQGERFVYVDIGTYAGQKDTCLGPAVESSAQRHHVGPDRPSGFAVPS